MASRSGLTGSRQAEAVESPIVAELTDEQRAAIRACRDEVQRLRDSKWGQRIPIANATTAVLLVADGASLAEAARRTGQPEWRVAFWGALAAERGAEGVEEGWQPPGAVGADPGALKVGVGVDCALTPAAIADWARSTWLARDLAVDLDEEAVFLNWPENMEVVGISAGEQRLEHMRRYYLKDWSPPPGARVVALSVEFQGRMSNPDTVNRAIEIDSFLDQQAGILWFNP